MKKLFAISLLIISILSAAIMIAQDKKTQPQPFSYSKQWKKVEDLAEKQLPESALKAVEVAEKQAQSDNNTPQLVKATIYKMRFTLEKEPDKATQVIADFERFTNKIETPADRALLISMTAELYLMFYQNDRWTIDRRTEILGQKPENIKQWTKNIFIATIDSLLDLSLENAAILQKTPITKYNELLIKGADSQLFQPALFDFLAYRKIDILKSLSNFSEKNEKIYTAFTSLRDFHLNDPQPAALIYVALQNTEFGYNLTNDNTLYIKTLTSISEEFKNSEYSVEVLEKMANFYLQNKNETQNSDYKRRAYEICQDGIQRFPNYKRINILKNTMLEITQKMLHASHAETLKPNSDLKINISSTNVNAVKISIFRVNATALDYYKFRKDNDKAFTNRTLTKTYNFSINADKDFDETDSIFIIKSGNYGIYEMEISATENTEPSLTNFTVTDFACITRADEQDKKSLYVLDRQTGSRQSGVTVKSYLQEWTKNGYAINLKQTQKTDNEGLCIIPFVTQYNNDILFFERGEDKFFSNSSYIYYNKVSENGADQNIKVAFFTDRSLYRHAQTVYFKGIAYYIRNKKSELSINTFYTVELRDANNQKIAEKQLKTNEFGSFAGEFVLPANGLNGAYTLRASGANDWHTIYVEEYKRPTFEIALERPKDEVRFDEKVTVTGSTKAYAGYSLADAKVSYRVTRRSHWYHWRYEPETEIAKGETSTNQEGKFSVDFLAEKPVNQRNNITAIYQSETFYTYTVYADVTDTKGETQKVQTTVSVGDKSLIITVYSSEKIKKTAGAKFAIHTKTLNDEIILSDITYEVFAVESADYAENTYEDTKFTTAEKMLSGVYHSAEKMLLLDVKTWKSGRYKIVLKTNDKFGNEVIENHVFIVYENTDKQPPVKTYVWQETLKSECTVGEAAKIRFGTSCENTQVLFEIIQGNTIFERRWLTFNNEIQDFNILFKENYGAGVNVFFTFMKDEQLFTQQITVKRKTEQKTLTPRLSVFRDRLQPNEKAEWVITVPSVEADNYSSLPKNAEILATMYDASLDAIRPHSWSFYPHYQPSVLYSTTWQSNNFSRRSSNADFKITYLKYDNWKLNRLNWFGLSNGHFNLTQIIQFNANELDDTVVVTRTGKQVNIKVSGAINTVQFTESEELDGDGVPDSRDKATSMPAVTVTPRTNFAETAFFYPQQRTDSAGNVKIAFTAPESLTRWNVKLLAHTQDLFVGQLDTTAITQKYLMLQMNLPRFVRRSDKLELKANLTNLTDKDLTANVRLELIDPTTEKVLYSQEKMTDILTTTSTVSFSLSFGEGWGEVVTVKMVAVAGDFSDGEQRYLPILPDKVLITESLPLTVRAGQTRTYDLSNFPSFQDLENLKSFTVEFSLNPAWYAVQALPTIAISDENNAISLFTAFYANSLAAHIANSNPKIKQIFEQWKSAAGSRNALLSNLEHNQELKNMLLEETPWMTATKNESEQKRQIALLFDLNNQTNNAQQNLDKLLKLQTVSGGFSWYADMPASRYITQEILLNWARLNRLTNANVEARHATSLHKDVISKALNYLDLEISRDFENLKKYNKNYLTQNCVGDAQLFYLHTRSEYKNVSIPDFAKEAVAYYTRQSEKYWTSFTLYGKAMMAIVAQRNGKTAVAAEILKSLRENALKTDELGMYWAKNTAGYFWDERPVAVQAAIIEAFSEIAINVETDNYPSLQNEINELKIWLLKQKQTQCWDSPISTVNAIYALLLQGNDWLVGDNSVQIKLDNKTLQPEMAEAGTGYFKESIPTNEITKETGKITVSSNRQNASIGWGAVYWQHFVEKAETNNYSSLQIDKKLFVKDGNAMRPIEQTQAKMGNRIVTRLVVTTDRNLEFVALKDLRAGGIEPVEQRSFTTWKEGVCYYQTTKDASTQFFFNFLPKGTYVFEYESFANNAGEFSTGIASVQCQYAPEFVSYAGGGKMRIE